MGQPVTYFIKVADFYLNLAQITVVEKMENAIAFRTTVGDTVRFEDKQNRDHALKMPEDFRKRSRPEGRGW